jgi:hypothetical protein
VVNFDPQQAHPYAKRHRMSYHSPTSVNRFDLCARGSNGLL